MTEAKPTFEPRIVGFFCNWCTYTAADGAGVSRIHYAANVRPIRVMCTGRIDPTFIFKAFAEGADGVLVGGCHPGQCHYTDGNTKALRRVTLLHRALEQMGIEKERLRLEWISGAEAPKLARVVQEFTAEIAALGPLGRASDRVAAADPGVGLLDGKEAEASG